ncbi:MAG TPA: hypothetical protein VFA60_16300 [Terriglobales bacterium]|nr:hypothetical protein [Terriglobales bacterium]
MRRVLALATLLIAVVASGTTVEPLSIETMTRRAARVVEARAIESWPAWDTSQHLIYTYTRFQVVRALKGSAAATVVVRQLGGSDGHYTQKVSGVRPWGAGQETVLFLRPSDGGGGVFAVVGLMQGDFRVTRAARGEAVVSNGVAGVSARGGSAFTGSHMRLSELEARVARAAVQP